MTTLSMHGVTKLKLEPVRVYPAGKDRALAFTTVQLVATDDEGHEVILVFYANEPGLLERLQLAPKEPA